MNLKPPSKTPLHLFPMFLVGPICDALAFGNTKYKPWNWLGAVSDPDYFDKYLTAAVSHLSKGQLAVIEGRDTADADSGVSHFAHAAANVLFLLAWERWRKTELTVTDAASGDTLPSAIKPYPDSAVRGPGCRSCEWTGLVGDVPNRQAACGECHGR